MQVMKLADSGEAGFEHLGVEEPRHGLDVIRAHCQREPVHDLTPGPERVVVGPPDFSETGHGALERVAVQVRHTG